MRFERGIHYPHPPRGPARKPYTMSEAALRQRCHNLRRTRLRSDRESLTIRLLIWQSCFESGPHASHRNLARQLHVWPSYVCKVRKQSARGLEALASGQRVTLDDLNKARSFTARMRQEEPGLLAPASPRRLYRGEPRVMTADEIIAEQRGFAEEWKRKNPSYSRQRVAVRVPVH